MLDNRKLLAIAIMVSIIGVTALFFYAASIGPETHVISEIGDDDVGSLVTLNGTIRSVRLLDDGSASLELVDLNDNSTIIIYMDAAVYDSWEKASQAIPGASIEVIGVVEKYQDYFEIVVSSSGDAAILSAAGDDLIPAWQLLSSPELFDGMTIRIRGIMKEPYMLTGDEGTIGMGFELSDEHENRTYSLGCVVFDDGIVEDYDIGDSLEAKGTFQYYVPTGSWQVVIDGEENMVLTQP